MDRCRGAAQSAGGAEGGEGGAGVRGSPWTRTFGGDEDSPGPRALHHGHLVTPSTQAVTPKPGPVSCPMSCPVSSPRPCPTERAGP